MVSEQLNLTSISNDIFFNVSYIGRNPNVDKNIIIQRWNISKFDSFGMSIFIKFSHPIYISTGKFKDHLKIIIK